MDTEECKLSVWLCQEEKVISGLSRRTTCADVIFALLEESRMNGAGSKFLSGPADSYCLVEKWRGFERTLPNKTKILRLWSAWGEEQEKVTFMLVKSQASLPNNGPRSAEAKVVLSKESPCNLRGTARVTLALPQDKQRRVVRKAFRKLAKINRSKRQESCGKEASCVERMETLVHLVLSQDHTIRQQIQRIRELDREIDRYEAKIHFDRMKRHGVNYVQDTYLMDRAPESEPRHLGQELEEYTTHCEQLLHLQEELLHQEEQMELVTLEIQEELNQRWMKRRQGEVDSRESRSSPPPEAASRAEEESLVEQERVRTQLSASLYIGLRLNTDLEVAKNDLAYTQRLCEQKQSELDSLMEKVNLLNLDEGQPVEEEEARTCVQTSVPEHRDSAESSSAWVESRALSTSCPVTDEDSDTGLSSMNSQDSDTIPVSESLV
ncbi:ras association domain-containing protein 10-like [Carcharodon carcharias]|uniref:ras association domain-containing protein 10-like n=1 Tax=Carcharodon carcharias TaxID=13397 RepID=UPI001B7E2734|nr:ras association domain-containing protein 10-like [Carcharodon carcharias]